MSLSGALTAAVTGIDAQSSALGTISNNIANSQTVGYKAVSTDFSTLLTVSNAQVNEPGGVTSTPIYGNDIQGTVEQTGINTNLAVSGSGMFAVSQALGANNSNSLPTFAPDPLYTRAGDFSLNSQGFLVNNAGYYLNGFAVNQTTGAVEKNALIPIQLNELEFESAGDRQHHLLGQPADQPAEQPQRRQHRYDPGDSADADVPRRHDQAVQSTARRYRGDGRPRR